MTDSVIRSRIDSALKLEASNLFEQMGLSLSEAIRLFIYQSVAEKRIPFYIGIPNTLTQETLDDADRGKGLQETSVNQLKADWNKACVK